jgi:hypothetical protein
MCQFAYFVGKVTHRPDARRQNKPASQLLVTDQNARAEGSTHHSKSFQLLSQQHMQIN